MSLQPERRQDLLELASKLGLRFAEAYLSADTPKAKLALLHQVVLELADGDQLQLPTEPGQPWHLKR